MKKNYPTPVVETLQAVGIIAAFYACMAVVAVFVA
jgi:hypothetical protein